MFMNRLCNSKLWRSNGWKRNGIFQNEVFAMFKSSKNILAKNTYGNINEKQEKNNKGTKNLNTNESNMEDKLQKMQLLYSKNKCEGNFSKKMNTFYIDNNFFFLIGCFFSLYSVFVYDFFANRCVQIFSNFFFLIFHFTKNTVNLLASILHMLFICFQVYVLTIKSNISLKSSGEG
ncbi:hypothetical protein, conserved [Plasmodium gonderi]|uniref:Uncharacterized protein n=1 Tax=Plasmodium gonderi TaxID=77519 RepID=A0A1Y1JE06_PLAGO|nr:hypothetical protein, conserved [Plasmodium gonderi]GAW80759.1 hypothetical protein, conserved [Plasmodium gonderi]